MSLFSSTTVTTPMTTDPTLIDLAAYLEREIGKAIADITAAGRKVISTTTASLQGSAHASHGMSATIHHMRV